MNGFCKLFALSALALPFLAQAQTTVMNKPGACTTDIYCSLTLVSGTGNVTFAAVVGPNCLLGQSCAFGSGYAGSDFSYQLPDGSSANANNFTGQMTYTGGASCGTGCTASYYTITGTFAGQDSQGRAFTGSTVQDITINHARGNNAVNRGGTTTLTMSAGQPGAPGFSLSAPPSLPAVTAGQSAIASIAVATTGAPLSAPVSFVCFGLPAGATCAFDPPSLIVGASGASSTLTISTTARTSARRKPSPSVFAFLLGLGGTVLQAIPRRLRASAVGLLLLLSVLFVSCGGAVGSQSSSTSAGTSGGTSAGSFQIAVTGTSSAVQSSTTITLVVR